VAPAVEIVAAARAGYVTAVRAEAMGRAANALGAGRTTVADRVDHGVGLLVRAKPGDRVREGEPLVELRHRDGRGLDAAVALCRHAVTIGEAPPAVRPKVLAEVR
jgi:pyrimidine-nucleoside phosphorylase/thymidine phosphorylase